jgi:hypothetical protein
MIPKGRTGVQRYGVSSASSGFERTLTIKLELVAYAQEDLVRIYAAASIGG